MTSSMITSSTSGALCTSTPRIALAVLGSDSEAVTADATDISEEILTSIRMLAADSVTSTEELLVPAIAATASVMARNRWSLMSDTSPATLGSRSEAQAQSGMVGSSREQWGEEEGTQER